MFLDLVVNSISTWLITICIQDKLTTRIFVVKIFVHITQKNTFNFFKKLNIKNWGCRKKKVKLIVIYRCS